MTPETKTPRAKKHKPLNRFEQGYICAVSTLIGGHGAGTEAYDTFVAMGIDLERIYAWEHLSEYDRENLKELESWM